MIPDTKRTNGKRLLPKGDCRRDGPKSTRKPPSTEYRLPGEMPQKASHASRNGRSADFGNSLNGKGANGKGVPTPHGRRSDKNCAVGSLPSAVGWAIGVPIWRAGARRLGTQDHAASGPPRSARPRTGRVAGADFWLRSGTPSRACEGWATTGTGFATTGACLAGTGADSSTTAWGTAS